MCTHTTLFWIIPLHMCPRTAKCIAELLYMCTVSSTHIPLHMCPRTATYMCTAKCIAELLYMCTVSSTHIPLHMCPRTATYIAELLYMCS